MNNIFLWAASFWRIGSELEDDYIWAGAILAPYDGNIYAATQHGQILIIDAFKIIGISLQIEYTVDTLLAG